MDFLTDINNVNITKQAGAVTLNATATTKLAGNPAMFKSGSSTYSDNDTSQTFTDSFCTAASLVIVSITGVTPQGAWTVTSAAGSFTITSTVAESADITFDYYIIKAVT